MPREYVLLTDLESDDVLSMLLLKLRGFVPRLVIVGEGNAACKVVRARHCLRLLYGNDVAALIPVLQGMSSNKPFHADGNECLPTCNDQERVQMECAQALTRQQIDACTASLEEIQLALSLVVAESHQAPPLIIALKPLREFVALDTSPAFLATCRACDLALYGSFNFRAMFWDNVAQRNVTAEVAPRILALLSQFRSVRLYESHHATGEGCNSIDESNAHELFAKLHEQSTGDNLQSVLMRLVHSWNQHIMSKARVVITQLSALAGVSPGLSVFDQERLLRNRKIVASIEDQVDGQMVLADQGLCTVLLDDELEQSSCRRGVLFFDERGYTQWQPNVTSNTLVYTNLAIADVVARMTRLCTI